MNSNYKQAFLKLSVFLALFMLGLTKTQAADIPSEVSTALKTGNAALLAKYFNSQVECVVLENENIYTKNQAEIIVKDFFLKHKPTAFNIVHKGGKDASQYVIGNLKTQKGTYRVTILFKNVGNTSLIHQFRIEKEGNE